MSVKILPQYIAGLSASFGAFCMGASIGWTSPAEEPLLNGKYGFDVSTLEFDWISSILTLGAATVCIPIGFLIDAFGRKPTMLGLIPPYMVGWLLVTFATNTTMLYFGRFILGVCGGSFCVTAPMYTTEIAQLHLRGVLGSFFALLIVMGILYGYIVGAFVELATMNILCAILPIIFVAFFVFMPESPVYLVQKNRKEAARQTLIWLRGKNYDIEHELKEIETTIHQTQQISFFAALRRPVTLKGLRISMALLMLMELSGVDVIIFYSTSIFQEASTGFSSSLSTITVGAVMVVFTFVSILIIDSVGRRILLLVSAFFMVVTTVMMGAYFQVKDSGSPAINSLGWMPLCSLCFFMVFFSIGFGSVPYVLCAELFAEDVKSVAGSIALMTNWLMLFVTTVTFPVLRESIGEGPTFWIFSGFNALAFIYSWIEVPETKGKTIIEIQEILGGVPEQNENEKSEKIENIT